MEDLEREWSQEELKKYLMDKGKFVESDFIKDEIIPQGVKFLNFEKPNRRRYKESFTIS